MRGQEKRGFSSNHRPRSGWSSSLIKTVRRRMGLFLLARACRKIISFEILDRCIVSSLFHLKWFSEPLRWQLRLLRCINLGIWSRALVGRRRKKPTPFSEQRDLGDLPKLIHNSTIYLFVIICLSICLSIYHLSIYLSICLSTYQFINLSIYLFSYLFDWSIYLCVYRSKSNLILSKSNQI